MIIVDFASLRNYMCTKIWANYKNPEQFPKLLQQFIHSNFEYKFKAKSNFNTISYNTRHYSDEVDFT